MIWQARCRKCKATADLPSTLSAEAVREAFLRAGWTTATKPRLRGALVREWYCPDCGEEGI